MLESFKKDLAQNDEVYLRVKVRPNANQTIVKDILEDQTIKLDVAAPPVKGKANIEIIKFLANEFAIKKNNIKLIAGQGEPIKLIKLVKYE